MNALAPFLRPDGFAAPALGAALAEASVFAEAVGHVRHRSHAKRVRRSLPLAARVQPRDVDPVLLVPGFMAGDGSLALLGRWLRDHGVRTYRSQIRSNVGCTWTAGLELERRLEQIADRRGSRVTIVGHSLGGLLARGLAVRRPDLVSGIVTMGSPMLAPGAHHPSLSVAIGVLTALSRAGVPGLMSTDCVGGECARLSFDEARQPLSGEVAFTAIFSKRDGIVDWKACVDPLAAPVEVRASHVGMAVDPRTADEVVRALRTAADARRAAANPPISLVG